MSTRSSCTRTARRCSTGPGGSVPLSAESAPEDALLKGGVVLDAYGTTVVKPGIVPDAYHVLGSEAKTPAELQGALAQMEAAYTDKAAIAAIVSGLVSAGKKEAYDVLQRQESAGRLARPA